MSFGGDDFSALLEQASVKEDYMDLGLPERKPAPTVLAAKDAVEVKSEEDRRIGGKKYKVKIVDGSSTALCLSYIGSGASFCLKKNCSTNHAPSLGVGGQSLFIPPREGVLVIVKSSTVAFTSPTLKLTAVEAEVVQEWDRAAYSLEDWQNLFQASNQGEDLVMSIDDIKTEAQASKGFESFRTPAKKKRVVVFEPDPVFLAYSPAFSDEEARSDFRETATPASVADSLLEMDISLSQLSRGVERMFLGSTVNTREAEATADMSFRMSKGLEGLVGSSEVMDDSEFICPTVWGTLATLGAEIANVKNIKPAPVKVQDLGPIRAELRSSHDKITESVSSLGRFSKLFAKTMIQRVSTAEAEIKRLLTRSRPQSPTSTFGEELDGLLAAARGPQNRPPPAVAPAPDLADRLEQLELRLDRALESNEDLERRLARIMADNEVDAIKFAGLGLKSVAEVDAWVAVHFPCRSYGLIIDVYLLLDLIADDGPTTQKDLITEMKRRKDLDIATEAEGQALTAFLAEVPRLFHISSPTLRLSGDNASCFSRVPTYKAWSNSGGLKKEIEKQLAKLKKSLREVLLAELHSGTLAYIVAVEALEKTISWVGAFNTYLDTTYEHLHIEVGFTSARAWSLTTQLANRIFSDLHSVRVGTMKAMRGGPESICPAILWAVFRTHDKMAGFEDANFENHPSIASEFVKFLATNTGIEGMAVLEENVVSLKTKVKELEKLLTAASVKADKASSNADVAKKATDVLTKQVDKLAAKI